MDSEWTPRSTFPKRLYRVYHPCQIMKGGKPKAKGNARTDLIAPGKKVNYPFKTHAADFVDSIIAHRQQSEKIKTPYISFFEDLSEAEVWCLAAQDNFYGTCYIIVVDMTSKWMEKGLQKGFGEKGKISCWRVGDVVKELGLNHHALGVQSGLERMDSEWMFVKWVPGTAFVKGFISSADIRRKYALQGGLEGIVLKCGCTSEKSCLHFDENFD
ncbi:hypothetical protein EG329_001370 [Mollisiaceae sp. DMI_Dod_QoI]|nr:hypothetical protein EG329_001370 [Helotiales sp. DMI_Dod_QoI]